MFQMILMLVLSLVAIGEAGAASGQSLASPSRQHLIEIQAFSFKPHSTDISPGDRVLWINRDVVPHAISAEGGMWLTHILEEGQSWEMAVEGDGKYPYFCEFHPNMKGLLVTR